MKMSLFSEEDYCHIQIANSFGLDKESWIDRLLWVQENKENLERYTTEAEEPELYEVAVWNYRNRNKDGIVQLDATASGLQLMSCISHDIKTAEWTNLLGGKRYDVYTELYDKMELCKEKGIKRKDIKKAVMTAFYGSQATPSRILVQKDLQHEFYQVLREHCKEPWYMNQLLQASWNRKTDRHEWFMSDGFHVVCPVWNQEVKIVTFMDKKYAVTRTVSKPALMGKSLSANVVHSLDAFVQREVIRRLRYTSPFPEVQGDTYDIKEDVLERLHTYFDSTGFLSARVLSYLHVYGFKSLNRCSPRFNEAVYKLLGSLPDERIDVLCAHDCFGVKYRYGNVLRRTYNQVLSELAESDVGSFVLNQVCVKEWSREKKDNFSRCIQQADYALS